LGLGVSDTFNPRLKSVAKASKLEFQPKIQHLSVAYIRMAPKGKRIVFTGGSGKAGRHVIPELQKRGYEILNIDLTEFPDPSANVFTLKTDLTDSGQGKLDVWGNMITY
jgi:hypothetical protein